MKVDALEGAEERRGHDDDLCAVPAVAADAGRSWRLTASLPVTEVWMAASGVMIISWYLPRRHGFKYRQIGRRA